MFRFLRALLVVALAFLGGGVGYSVAEEYGIAADGSCRLLCTVPGMRAITTSTGRTVNLFAESHTKPSLVVSDGVSRCYADLVLSHGATTGINIIHSNGDRYHTVFGGVSCDPCQNDEMFCFSPATTSTSYQFNLTAAGNFTVDWGDGNVEQISKSDTNAKTVTHTYSGPAANYTIHLTGTATGYSSSDVGAITFDADAAKLSWMAGCLGCVFPTLSNGKQPLFYSTFLNNTELTGVLPANLFNGIRGQPAAHMFRRTFEGCANLTGEVPDNFFHISGSPTERLFSGTFNKSGISGISEGAFSGLKGAGATYAFGSTFANTQNLTEVPGGIFDGITSSASSMFSQTFMGSGIVTIPDGLFANMKTTAASLFSQTFSGCTNLSGSIENIFGDLTGSWQTGMFRDTFNGCTALDGLSARVGPADARVFLYERWTNPSDATGAYAGDTSLIDYDCIPKSWGGGGTSDWCDVDGDVDFPTDTFTFVPDDAGTTFSFTISAAGRFGVDWGDGTVQLVSKGTTAVRTVSHTYRDGLPANRHTVGLGGLATGYSDDEMVAAISFESDASYSKSGVQEISGCLGCIFPTLANGKQPRFIRLFRYNGNLRGPIPSELFSGVRGQPVSSMFRGIFEYCKSLDTEIPEDLFSGINGTPASEMFRGAFREYPGTEIPAKLFHGVKGAPAYYMFAGAFWGCPNLETIPAELFATLSGTADEGAFEDTFRDSPNLRTLPSGLFGGVTGKPSVSLYHRTFTGCTGLESIPDDLFGDITGGALGENTFVETFSGCTALQGASATIGGVPLYEIWPSATSDQVGACYQGATGLDDYGAMPTAWK